MHQHASSHGVVAKRAGYSGQFWRETVCSPHCWDRGENLGVKTNHATRPSVDNSLTVPEYGYPSCSFFRPESDSRSLVDRILKFEFMLCFQDGGIF